MSLSAFFPEVSLARSTALLGVFYILQNATPPFVLPAGNSPCSPASSEDCLGALPASVNSLIAALSRNSYNPLPKLMPHFEVSVIAILCS